MLRVALVLVTSIGCGARTTPTAPTCGSANITSVEESRSYSSCAELASVSISGASPLELSALGELRVVRGDVVIGPSSQLTSVRGLDGVESIGGSLRIERSFELVGVFLGNLTTVRGDLIVAGNVSLTTVSLGKLREVDGSLTIRGNSGVELIDLGALTRVGGDLHIDGPRVEYLFIADEIAGRGERHIDRGQPPTPAPGS